MRLVMFDDFKPGLLRGDEVVDLAPAIGDIARLPWDERMPALVSGFGSLRAGIERQAADGRGVPLSIVRLRAPVPRPTKLLSGLVNFGVEPGKLDYAFKSPESIVGSNDTIDLPDLPVSRFECEAALAFVIGRESREVAEADGAAAVFGYTAMIDVSGRDLGRPVGTFLSKSFDTFGPMGPCVVTANELADPHALQIRLSINGVVAQEYSTKTMANSIASQVATATAIMTLYPGDVLTCGAVPQPAGPLKDGDEVRVEIAGIGGFAVRVRDAQRRAWPAA